MSLSFLCMQSLVFLFLLNTCSSQKPTSHSKSIKILNNTNEYIANLGDNFIFVCEADFSISWFSLGHFLPELFNGNSNYTKSTWNETTEAGVKYRASIEISHMSENEVDSYICAYSRSKLSDQTFGEIVNALKEFSILVYLNASSVPSNNGLKTFISTVPELKEDGCYQPNDECIYFPCRALYPNVTIKLKETGGPQVNFTFGPHLGFVTLEKTNLCQEKHKKYTCTFHLEGRDDDEHSFDVYEDDEIPSVNGQKQSFDMHITEGNELQLNCNIYILDGHCLYNLTWKHEHHNLLAMKKKKTIQMKYTGSLNTLRVPNITKTHSGNYTCIFYDLTSGTNINDNYNLTVNVIVHAQNQSFIEIKEPNNVKNIEFEIKKDHQESDHIEINLDYTSHPAADLDNITWIHQSDGRNKSIKNNDKYNITKTSTHTYIIIRDVTLADAGEYILSVQNTIDVQYFTMTVEIKAAASVSLYANSFYKYNTSASILCHVDGFPLPKIEWFIQSCDSNISCQEAAKKRISYKTKFNNTQNGTETEVVQRIEQPFMITCRGENDVGIEEKSLLVYASDLDVGFGIAKINKNITVGDEIYVECVLSKNCEPDTHNTMMWRSPHNQTIQNNYMIQIIEQNSTLSHKLIMVFPNIGKNQSGDYFCTQNISSGPCASLSSSDKISLQVLDEEIVTFDGNKEVETVSVDVGYPLVLACEPRGMPVPEITWYKDGEIIKDVEVEVRDEGRQLYIEHATEGHHGKYKCQARNRLSQDSKVMEVKVSGLRTIHYIIILSLLVVLFIIPILILLWKIRKERQKIRELRNIGLLNFDKGAAENLNPDLGINEQAELLPYDKKWEFPKDKLKLGKQLGYGAFGVVMKGVATGIVTEGEKTDVAVKMVRQTGDPAFLRALASELKILVHLGKHLNVVNLLGACTKNLGKRELYVIVEYCRFGNLHHYLMRHRANFIDQLIENTDIIDPSIGCEAINRTYSSNSRDSGLGQLLTPLLRSTEPDLGRKNFGLSTTGDTVCSSNTCNSIVSMLPSGEFDNAITSSGSVQPDWRSNVQGDYDPSDEDRLIYTQDLIYWSFQIAKGMEYLTKRKILHGDLAARNVLLTEDNVVKICDFGLAKNMSTSDNYKKKGKGPLPIKWMAVESIRDRIFSTQSDVWSYGIVLWELFSLASTPYSDMEADDRFCDRLLRGYRMKRPKYASKKIYQTMLECWQELPKNRPSFHELSEKLGNQLDDSVRNHFIGLNDHYVDMNSRWLADKEDFLTMVRSPNFDNVTAVNTGHEYVNEPTTNNTFEASPAPPDSGSYLCMSPTNPDNVRNQTFIFPSNPKRPKDTRSEGCRPGENLALNETKKPHIAYKNLPQEDKETEQKSTNKQGSAISNPNYTMMSGQSYLVTNV